MTLGFVGDFVNTEEEPTSNSCRHLAAVEQPDVYFFKIR